MGKHERQSIEEAEKIIEKLLKVQKLSNSDKKNRWFNHAISIARKIKKDFPSITSARHLGNRYEDTGDILIVSAGKKHFIEIKMSDTKLGVGTKANISQNALTDNGLFKNKIKEWSLFRKGKHHNVWVNNYLNQFTKYPQKILKTHNPTKQKYEKARHLRELARKGNKKAKSILGKIQRKDRKEKIEYLTYLRNQKQEKKMIKRFFILIILGIHKKEELKDLLKKDIFFREIKTLFIYYANLDKNKIIVRREDAGKKIKQILAKHSNFKILFPGGLTHCKLVGVRGRTLTPLLQIALHWKNIAQGIKTPCLNIFDLI